MKSICCGIIFGLWASVIALPVRADDEPRVTAPPQSLVTALRLSPFYRKCVSAKGFPILSSEKVSDVALLEAAFLIEEMLSHRNEIRAALIKNKVRFVVMAPTELTTAVPEHSDLAPAKYWDRRARGLGATPARPAVSCGEENLLNYPGDPYAAESILIHEFSHAMHEMGLNSVDATFDQRLHAAYTQAIAAGLWKGTYASTNRMEYWAEGAQSWFQANRANDREHNDVDTREELKAYDKPLAKLLEEVFGDGPWRYRKPLARKPPAPHLKGYDPSRSPRFSWPKDAELKKLPLIKPADNRHAASPSSNRRTTILFVNGGAKEVEIQWLDLEGKLRSYGRVRPGATLLQETYAGHVWQVLGDAGKPIAMFVASDEPARAVIE